MKKLLLLSFILVLGLSFSSCKKDTPLLGSTVKVKVKNLLGIAQTNTTVYMYKDQEVTNSTSKSDAKKQVVTNSDGMAEFDLNFTDLNITESQTTLYFAVFYNSGGEDKVAGTTGVTVRRNEVKDLEITIPL